MAESRLPWPRRFGGELIALVSGAVLTLAFAPFNLYVLTPFVIAALLYLWQDLSPRRAAWRGFMFGLGLYASGVSWVYFSLHNYGNAPLAFAAFINLLLIVYLAIYPAVMGYVLNRWWPRAGSLRWLLAAPALWAVLEWLRSWMLTGFPWLSLGYSQTDSTLAGLAPYLGVFGISWVLLLSAGLLLLLIQQRQYLLWSGCLAALWVGAWGLGQFQWVAPAAEPFRVSLIQGNVDQSEKFQTETLERSLVLYTEMGIAAAKDSAVVIWPETAIPRMLADLDPVFVKNLQQHARVTKTDYVTGIFAGSWDTGVFHNSVMTLGSTTGVYHKRRLLPFGEYFPLRFIIDLFQRFVDIPMSDLTPGAADQPLLIAAGQPVGVSICFEAAFGSEIRRALPTATWLINVSNDAWFGDSLAPHQHLQITRMRALEARRYIARATNTGISAIIDPNGQIVTRGEQFVVTVIAGEIQPLQGATPYVWGGNWPLLILLALLLVVALLLRPKSRAE